MGSSASTGLRMPVGPRLGHGIDDPSKLARVPSNSLHLSSREWPRLPSTARPSHPPALDAPRRVACPSEHILIVRVLRAKRAPGRSLPVLLRPRVARAQKIISLHPFPLLSRYRPIRHTGPPWKRIPHLPVKLSRSGTKLCWRLRRRSPRTATSTNSFEILLSAFLAWSM